MRREDVNAYLDTIGATRIAVNPPESTRIIALLGGEMYYILVTDLMPGETDRLRAIRRNGGIVVKPEDGMALDKAFSVSLEGSHMRAVLPTKLVREMLTEYLTGKTRNETIATYLNQLETIKLEVIRMRFINRLRYDAIQTVVGLEIPKIKQTEVAVIKGLQKELYRALYE